MTDKLILIVIILITSFQILNIWKWNYLNKTGHSYSLFNTSFKRNIDFKAELKKDRNLAKNYRLFKIGLAILDLICILIISTW